MAIPQDLKYTEEHEWADFSGEDVTIGITDFAQGQLGDIVFLEFPNIGDEVARGISFGEIEAVKTVSELFAPISGTITMIAENISMRQPTSNRKMFSINKNEYLDASAPFAQDNIRIGICASIK